MLASRNRSSLSFPAFLLLAVFALGLAAYYRLPKLDARPLHTDEAILATKSAEFWTTGHFEYDPKDYHGPALHYLTRIVGTLGGWGDPNTWPDTQVRYVAVGCSLLLILITLLGRDALGRFGTVLAMLLSAVSPMMVYYSRYYIMEILLVLLVALSLASMWRYTQGGSRLWLAVAGLSFGLQHATKETFVINVGALFCGWIAAKVVAGGFEPRSNSLSFGSGSTRPRRAFGWVLIPAILASVASFSEGFTDWEAVQESFTTYGNYLQRSEGSGHEKPWFYYLGLIFYHKDTMLWTEALIGGLGVVGMIHGFFGRHTTPTRQAALVFLTIYTLAQFTVYSILAYKTPWSILTAQHSLTLLAGAGAGALWNLFAGRLARLVLKVLFGLGIYHLCSQTMLVIDHYRADSRNPYCYEHTSTHLMELVERMQRFAALEGDSFSAQVINADSGWPLPWYWRNLPNIGYRTSPPAKLKESVIVFDAELLNTVRSRLGRNLSYNEGSYYGQRPNRTLMVFVKDDLWQKFMQERTQPKEQGSGNP
jgi:uncharacterized protein (TIGR03663 family)